MLWGDAGLGVARSLTKISPPRGNAMPRDARDVTVTVANDRLLKDPPDASEHTQNGNGNGHAALAIEVEPPASIAKRDGRIVPFEIDRIENALSRCFAG